MKNKKKKNKKKNGLTKEQLIIAIMALNKLEGVLSSGRKIKKDEIDTREDYYFF